MSDRLVDPSGAGDYVTVGDALAAAEPGDRLLIRPGTYRESLTVDKRIEIVGQGDRDGVVIETTNDPVVQFMGVGGRLAHLTLYQTGCPKGQMAVKVVDVRAPLVIEDCDIVSVCGPCIDIWDSRRCIVQRNRIHGSTSYGIELSLTLSCTVVYNDIFDHARAGITIHGGRPTVRGNQIHDNQGFGIMHMDGYVLVEGNQIYANEFAGVYIRGGRADIRGNRITQGYESGVFVHHARALVEDNEIVFNRLFGVDVFNKSNVTLRRNRIRGNGSLAVVFVDRSRGALEDNDLRGMAYNAARSAYARCHTGRGTSETRQAGRRRGRSGARGARGARAHGAKRREKREPPPETSNA